MQTSWFYLQQVLKLSGWLDFLLGVRFRKMIPPILINNKIIVFRLRRALHRSVRSDISQIMPKFMINVSVFYQMWKLFCNFSHHVAKSNSTREETCWLIRYLLQNVQNILLVIKCQITFIYWFIIKNDLHYGLRITWLRKKVVYYALN